MKVLVTGASGMLGRAVTASLIARGDEVTVVQRRAAGLECREIRGDLADAQVCDRAAAGQDAVIHLAAKVDVVGARKDFYRTNVHASNQLALSARRAGSGRFVYVSSPSVAHAGHALVGAAALPADPETARGNYATTKAIAEKTLLATSDSSFAVTAIRPHLVWGPGDTQLVARIVQRARNHRLATVGSGAALIDTTYVDNAAEAIIAGLDHCPDASGRPFVVSNGEPRPVAEIVARVCRAAGVAPPRWRVPYPVAWLAGGLAEVGYRAGLPGEPPMTRFLANQLSTAHWFDQRETREVLHWTPRINLELGFRRLAEHYAAGAN